MILLTTSGHRKMSFVFEIRPQNHPLESMKPTWFFRAAAAIGVFPTKSALVILVLQVFIVALRESRQSTGCRFCRGGSARTMTLRETFFMVNVNAVITF